MKFGVGQPVPRKEDPRLVTGGGQFTDDVNLALANAVLNAVEHLGIETIDMPLTSEKPWRAING